MRVERGVETRGVRIRLTLQSEDGTAHSLMSNHSPLFEELIDRIQDVALQEVRSTLSLIPKEELP